MSSGARPKRAAERIVIGALERVDIPSWGVRGLDARVDTGARTSALHVEELVELGDGRVRFTLERASRGRSRAIETVVARRARVRSTSGKVESRVFVNARIVLGAAEYRVEIGLVDRRHMQNAMLIGRSALSGRFLVDAGRRYLLAPRARQ
jgi:hypothetical protein